MRLFYFWHELIDHDPQWLYFDSKVVPYSELCQGLASARSGSSPSAAGERPSDRRLNAVPASSCDGQ